MMLTTQPATICGRHVNRSNPPELHRLTWFHAYCYGGYTLYQLPFVVTNQLWIIDMDGQFSVSNALERPSPDWQLVKKLQIVKE